MKKISYELKKITEGVDEICNVVKSTLGPAGKNVGIVKGSFNVANTKDGVTVAKECIPCSDPVKNYAMAIVKKAADKTVEKAGDGTTTTCVLTQAIYNESKKFLEESRMSISDFCKDLDDAVNIVISNISPKEVNANDELFKKVISISTNNDEELTDVVTTALQQVGVDGIVTVEENTLSSKTELVKVDGLCFDQGYVSPYFVNNQAKMEARYEATPTGEGKPLVLVYDGSLNSAEPIIHLMEGSVQSNRPFVVIAEDISGECLATMIVNRMRANAKFLAIKSPGYGDAKKNWLHDIAILTGATVVDPRAMDIKDCGLNILGSCSKIVSTQFETTIVGCKDTEDAVKKHIEDLQAFCDSGEKAEYYREKLQERIARLKNGVTIIKLFARNEIENKEKADRVDDAIKAGKSALKEGVVPGCGVSYIRAVSKGLEDNEAVDALTKALYAPYYTILRNAGKSETFGSNLIEEVKQNDLLSGIIYKDRNFKISPDAYKSGIVDPFLVIKTALLEATSAAKLLLNTTAVIYEEKEKEHNCGC